MLTQVRSVWNVAGCGALVAGMALCAGLALAGEGTGSPGVAVAAAAPASAPASPSAPAGTEKASQTKPGNCLKFSLIGPDTNSTVEGVLGTNRSPGVWGGMTDIVVGVMFLGLPVMILGVVLFFRYRRERLLHETIRMMIEKGTPIPTELFDAPRRKRSDLRRGVFWMALGAGALVYLKAIHSGQWVGGLIPLLIGVAYLVVWRIERSKPAA